MLYSPMMKSLLSILILTSCIYNWNNYTSLALSVINNNNVNTNSSKKQVSIVTGANGYLGRQIIHSLISHYNDNHNDNNNDNQSTVIHSSSSSNSSKSKIICLVRHHRVKDEIKYWKKVLQRKNVSSSASCDIDIVVMPYDMLDGGISVQNAIHDAFDISNDNDTNDNHNTPEEVNCCIYHVASIFTPTPNHQQMAMDNVKGAQDLINAVITIADTTTSTSPNYHSFKNNIKIVLTSSMAAVRGSGQTPLNSKWYTHLDWNQSSILGENWGSSYQWSKAESERQLWDLSTKHNIRFTALCPSFIFGPPVDNVLSQSYAITLVQSWLKGESPVQSRLCVDVRDVAKAHVIAGTSTHTDGKRIIISREERIPSTIMAERIRSIAKETGMIDNVDQIIPDTKFDGGAIKIGDKEVECTQRMKQYLNGLTCRSVEDTMADMARSLLLMA